MNATLVRAGLMAGAYWLACFSTAHANEYWHIGPYACPAVTICGEGTCGPYPQYGTYTWTESFTTDVDGCHVWIEGNADGYVEITIDDFTQTENLKCQRYWTVSTTLEQGFHTITIFTEDNQLRGSWIEADISVSCPTECGNGILETNEECDDGARVPGDGCSDMCRNEFCGDGLVNNHPNEQCDDGNDNDDDGCTTYCIKEYCGDGVIQTYLGEECDDGNTAGNDGCSSTCQEQYCGDGVVNVAGEECEDKNDDAEDGCYQCKVEECGDGIVQPGLGEQCDDGENNSDTEPDACRTDCINDRCGDGVIDSDEECDPAIPGTVCNSRCDICQSDNECQGGLCGQCDTPCTRIACYCAADGSCERESVPDDSCTGGECNPWPAPCGNLGADCGLPQDSCEWCILDHFGANGETYWQCAPYPNADILWPNQCGDPNSPPPPPPPPPSSPNNSSQRSQASSQSDGSSQSSTSLVSSDDSSKTESDSRSSTSNSSLDSSDDSQSASDANSDGDPPYSSSSSEGDDSADGGDTSSEGADADTDADGTDEGSSSSSTSYEQCDFCPACTSCRRCGIGLANVCDEQECSNLGLCTYEQGLFGGTCIANPDICGVCR